MASHTFEPTAFVELRVACKNLPKLDVMSKSDPFVVLHATNVRTGQLEKLGSTEVKKDDANPNFTKEFVLQYFFERAQQLKFQIYDCDDLNALDNLSRHQLIGEVECSLSDIVGAKGQCLVRDISGSKKKGSFRVIAEELKANPLFQFESQSGLPNPLPSTLEEWRARQNEVPKELPHVDQFVVFNCSGENLDKKDLFGKSDPYIKVYKRMSDGSDTLVYESPVLMKTLNPQWNSFEISLQTLCNNDTSRELKFEVWDWDKHSAHDLIGSFCTTLDKIIKENVSQYPLIHPKKQQTKKGYENSGKFRFVSVSLRAAESLKPNPLYDEWLAVERALVAQAAEAYKLRRREEALASGVIQGSNPFSFMEYVAGGCEISVIFGIDFTASNGSYQSSSSYHHLSSSKLNAYQQAIQAVGAIVAPYDHDQNFAVFGYGAYVGGEFPPLFHVNFNADNPECHGVNGVLEAYRECVPKVQFGDMGAAKRPDGKKYYGDDFYQLIQYAVKQCQAVPREAQKYFVILLIIDGDAFDVQSTIDTIIEAGDYPVSVVIVGVGSSSFSNCERFDADDTKLVHSSGKVQERDIVQFVPMKSFAPSDNASLAAAVLAEIPHQLTSYMGTKNLLPRVRLAPSEW